VTLTNLQANPTNVTQTINDLDITISSGSTAGSSLFSSTGQEITVNANGTSTISTSTTSTGWVYRTPTSTTLSLDGLGAGTDAPMHFIIGPPSYRNADGSIAGNGPSNPFLYQQATFMIMGAGLTADTTISALDFSFGNASGLLVAGVPPTTTTPLPAALPLFASGLGALGLLGWRRKRKARASLLGAA
jgi:hypothetical protein